MATLQAVLINRAETTLQDKAVEDFKTSVRGDVLTPDAAGYDAARLLWNGMHDKRPALIARCTGVADVIAAVTFARSHNLLVAVRGGGHNVAGSASCDGGIMIDLSLMNGVHVDPQARTARVLGGATWGDVDRETQVFGLATAGGVVSTTGVAGLTLGGGLGWLRSKHGLSIDNVLSVDMVTADGQVRTASKSENADLFWGIRGGGGNFGIITSFAHGFLADMEPYSSGGLYVNFAGFGEEGEHLVKDAYGASYTRLVALKNQYDPTNLFRLNQNIKPTEGRP